MGRSGFDHSGESWIDDPLTWGCGRTASHLLNESKKDQLRGSS